MIKKHINAFLAVWVVILFINQTFIFGCLAPYCVVAGMPHTALLAFLFVWFVSDNDDESVEEHKDEQEVAPKNAHTKTSTRQKKTLQDEIDEFDELMATVKTKVKQKKTAQEIQNRKDEKETSIQNEGYLKQKGDAYERYIGKQFEAKGDVVIYNGLMRGYEDDGVDIISISMQTKSIHLAQCKNWTKKPMLLSDIENIYEKLNRFDLSRISKSENAVSKHLQTKLPTEEIKQALKVNKKAFTIRKTLYASSDKVIDLNIGEKLTMIQTNIFRYEDMKIVITGT